MVSAGFNANAPAPLTPAALPQAGSVRFADALSSLPDPGILLASLADILMRPAIPMPVMNIAQLREASLEQVQAHARRYAARLFEELRKKEQASISSAKADRYELRRIKALAPLLDEPLREELQRQFSAKDEILSARGRVQSLVRSMFGSAKEDGGTPAGRADARANARLKKAVSPAESKAAARVEKILSLPGPIVGKDKTYIERWLPALIDKGLIGRIPSPEETRRVEGWFPQLNDWLVTGETEPDINCMAWALGKGAGTLSIDLSRQEVFRRNYGLRELKPEELDSAPDIAEFQPLLRETDSPSHWSRHLAGPWWESKLGGNLRILHRLCELEGDLYGKAAVFYRKELPKDPVFAAQAEINSQITGRGYIQGRDTGGYIASLGEKIGSELAENLLRLGPDQHWIDGGSGQNGALLTYFARLDPRRIDLEARWTWSVPTKALGLIISKALHALAEKPIQEKARATGITYSEEPGLPYVQYDSALGESQPVRVHEPAFELRDGLLPGEPGGKLRILSGKLFEEVSDTLEKADLITDIFGIFSYAWDPMQVLQKYLDLLNVGGSIYIHSNNLFVAGKDAPDPSSFDADWEWRPWAIPFTQWLQEQAFEGITVEVDDSANSFKLTKTRAHASLPPMFPAKLGEGVPILKLMYADPEKASKGLQMQEALKHIRELLEKEDPLPAEDQALLDQWTASFIDNDLLGRTPDKEEQALIEKRFPRLRKSPWKLERSSKIYWGEKLKPYWSRPLGGGWLESKIGSELRILHKTGRPSLHRRGGSSLPSLK
jgi:SAM-dependent methyltransferase